MLPRNRRDRDPALTPERQRWAPPFSAILADQEVAAHDDLESADPSTGYTPLTAAVRLGAASSVRSLLAHGVDPDAVDANGSRAIFLCRALNDTEVLEALLTAGADPLVETPLGETPMTCFAAAGASASIQKLIDHGAPVNEPDGDGWTALAWAAEGGHLEAVRALLAAGASPLAEVDGMSLAELAASRGAPDVAHLLAERSGLDPSELTIAPSPAATFPTLGEWLNETTFPAHRDLDGFADLRDRVRSAANAEDLIRLALSVRSAAREIAPTVPFLLVFPLQRALGAREVTISVLTRSSIPPPGTPPGLAIHAAHEQGGSHVLIDHDGARWRAFTAQDGPDDPGALYVTAERP